MVDYCFKWNQQDGVPGQPLTVDAARVRHETGEEYTAVLPPGPGTKFPVLVTTVGKTGVAVVTFLDAPGRRAIEYTFMKQPDDRLFLTRVNRWTYPNDEPGLRLAGATSHETVYFRPDGQVRRVVKNKVEQVKETVDHTDVPVDGNWEPVPAFGDYGSIARYERGGQVTRPR